MSSRPEHSPLRLFHKGQRQPRGVLDDAANDRDARPPLEAGSRLQAEAGSGQVRGRQRRLRGRDGQQQVIVRLGGRYPQPLHDALQPLPSCAPWPPFQAFFNHSPLFASW